MKTLKKHFAENFMPTRIVAFAPYALIFKTTNYCWYKCPHCCEKAGPDQEKDYIPENIICEYINQALKDKRFDKNIVFTGGEVFSAYRFHDTQYVPNILKHALRNDIGTDIKTNAGWATTSFGKDIFRDLKHVITDTHKPTSCFPELQISLSLDTYHANCFEKNLKVIKELAGYPVMIHLSSFGDQKDIVTQFNKVLNKELHPQSAFIADCDGNIRQEVQIIKTHTILIQYFATLFNSGRAVKLQNAEQIEFPQFSFMTSDGALLVAFDNFGRVTLGENSGHKISTPWVNYNMQPKKLDTIFNELFYGALKENLYYLFYEKFFHRYR